MIGKGPRGDGILEHLKVTKSLLYSVPPKSGVEETRHPVWALSPTQQAGLEIKDPSPTVTTEFLAGGEGTRGFQPTPVPQLAASCTTTLVRAQGRPHRLQMSLVPLGMRQETSAASQGFRVHPEKLGEISLLIFSSPKAELHELNLKGPREA